MLSEDIIRADGTVGPVGQRFEDALPAQSGSGSGLVTHDLGNFEIAGGLNGVLAWQPDPVIDLGPGTHLLKYTLTLVTVDWSTGDPANGLSVDLVFNDHANLNADEVTAAGWSDSGAGYVGQLPTSLYTTDPASVKYRAVGRMMAGRYGWLSSFWNEDLPDASATVHIVVETMT